MPNHARHAGLRSSVNLCEMKTESTSRMVRLAHTFCNIYVTMAGGKSHMCLDPAACTQEFVGKAPRVVQTHDLQHQLRFGLKLHCVSANVRRIRFHLTRQRERTMDAHASWFEQTIQISYTTLWWNASDAAANNTHEKAQQETCLIHSPLRVLR